MMSILGQLFSPIGRLIKKLDAYVLASDGIDCTEYIAAVESHFGIQITIPEAEALKTVNDLVLLVDQKLARTDRFQDEEAIWRSVQFTTSEHMGVDVQEIQRTTRYVEDLCC